MRSRAASLRSYTSHARCLVVGIHCLLLLSFGCRAPGLHVPTSELAPRHFDALQKEALAGSTDAQRKLGFAYLAGRGIEVNLHQANRWYQMAERAGDPQAAAALKALRDQTRRSERQLLNDRISLTRSIQSRLLELGYEPGPLDGIVGHRTRDAIRNFGQSIGASFDGEPDSAVLKGLIDELKRVKTVPFGPIEIPDETGPSIEAPDRVRAVDGQINASGSVRDDNLIEAVIVGGRPVRVDHKGAFSIRRFARREQSAIRIIAFDEWGNRAERMIEVVQRIVVGDEIPDVNYGE